MNNRPQLTWTLLLGAYGLASLVFGILAVLAIVQGRSWVWIVGYVLIAVLCALWLGVVIRRQVARDRARHLAQQPTDQP